MSSKSTPVTPSHAPESERITGYPTNRLFAVIDTSADLQSAVAALAAEPSGDQARVLCCDAGRDRIDAGGRHASLLGRLIRVTGLGLEATHVKRYDEELAKGHYVVEVEASNEAHRQRAATVLRAHGAHFINFYGRFAIEQMAP